MVLVVDLVVPGAVVEILVVVGSLGSVEPVDGDALVGIGEGGAGIVTGIGVGGADNDIERGGVGLNVGVAGRGAIPDEVVVGRDVGGRGVVARGGEEDEPELLAAPAPVRATSFTSSEPTSSAME